MHQIVVKTALAMHPGQIMTLPLGKRFFDAQVLAHHTGLHAVADANA